MTNKSCSPTVSFVPSFELPSVPLALVGTPADSAPHSGPALAVPPPMDATQMQLATPTVDSAMRIALAPIFRQLGWSAQTPLLARLDSGRVVIAAASLPVHVDSNGGTPSRAAQARVDSAGRLKLSRRWSSVLEAGPRAQVHVIADFAAETVTLMSLRAALRLLVA